MGASERGRQRASRPLPVWIIDTWLGTTGPRQPRPGILVDWRQVAPVGCTPYWEGLVVSASGGGEQQWRMELTWIHESELRPMDVQPPVAG